MHRSLVLAAALALAAGSAHAQVAAPDTLPFRPGQWGAEFGISNGVSGIGAIRFFSQRTALEANVNLAVDRMEVDDLIGTRSEFTGVDLRLGVRRYRTLGAAVAGFVSVGALGGYSHAEYATPSSPAAPTAQHSTRAGAYLQFGGQYHITPHLSLGAMYGVTAAYRRSHTDVDDSTMSGWGVGTPPVQLRVSLFF